MYLTLEELYWLKVTSVKNEEDKPKPFNQKEYNKKYYQEHKSYIKASTVLNRKNKLKRLQQINKGVQSDKVI